ncbi:MAG: hypothetical protein ACP5I8_13455, partial [Phycisphaerae bacterium]
LQAGIQSFSVRLIVSLAGRKAVNGYGKTTAPVSVAKWFRLAASVNAVLVNMLAASMGIRERGL